MTTMNCLLHCSRYCVHSQAKQVPPKKKEKENKKSVASTTNDAEVHNELITPELHKESYQSVSKHLGQKILTDALGAMHSSMVAT